MENLSAFSDASVTRTSLMLSTVEATRVGATSKLAIGAGLSSCSGLVLASTISCSSVDCAPAGSAGTLGVSTPAVPGLSLPYISKSSCKEMLNWRAVPIAFRNAATSEAIALDETEEADIAPKKMRYAPAKYGERSRTHKTERLAAETDVNQTIG